MAGAAAVLFTIIIPTEAEEQRLKDSYVSRELSTNTSNSLTPISTTTTTRAASCGSPTKNSSQNTKGPNISESRAQPTNISQQFDLTPKLPKSMPMPTIQVDLAEPNKTAGQCSLSKCNKTNHIDLPIDTAMEQVLRQILKKFRIINAVWLTNLEGSVYHVTFTVEFNELYEKLYAALQEWGIGEREGSTMSVINCLASKSYAQRAVSNEHLATEQNDTNIDVRKHGAWNRFMNSVHARLNIAQIVRVVRQEATITFDFCILLISAAVLASFGLVENSTIFLASSMLISPLMGPIIAAIFGTVIQESSLRRLGMRNELIGILLATLVGFLFGVIVCTTDKKYGIGEGLTEEMLSRCDLHSFVVGVFTAIPSGAAAAIGILGGNIGSLVGVAISASLMPPAVNAGVLWALAGIYKIFEGDDSRYLYVVKSHIYSDNQATELAILGSISMCLTLSNVLCIYVMGILVLKVKEIAPVISRNNGHFWMHDIKLARERNQHDEMSTDAAIIDEFSNLAKEDQRVLGIECDILRHLDDASYQHTWSPLSNCLSFDTQLRRDSSCTINRMEKLYTNTAANSIERNLLRRAATQRSNQMYLLESRPRFSTLALDTKSDYPQTLINVPSEMPSKRFTVTPASEDVPLN